MLLCFRQNYNFWCGQQKIQILNNFDKVINVLDPMGVLKDIYLATYRRKFKSFLSKSKSYFHWISKVQVDDIDIKKSREVFRKMLESFRKFHEAEPETEVEPGLYEFLGYLYADTFSERNCEADEKNELAESLLRCFRLLSETYNVKVSDSAITSINRIAVNGDFGVYGDLMMIIGRSMSYEAYEIFAKDKSLQLKKAKEFVNDLIKYNKKLNDPLYQSLDKDLDQILEKLVKMSSPTQSECTRV